jgi:riboflavin synthase
MFSGIVEEVGHIISINVENEYTRFELSAKKILDDIHIGDSIAVNGICLTVIEFTKNSFIIQAVPETRTKTHLNTLKIGDLVNLERAILPTTRIGGHLIQGHIDTTCEFLGFTEKNHGTVAIFSLPADYAQYFIDKGYIAIDGVSLTIATLNETTFEIALIPHTIENTRIKNYAPYQCINIEVDMVGKYLERFMKTREKIYV